MEIHTHIHSAYTVEFLNFYEILSFLHFYGIGYMFEFRTF